MTSPSFYLGAVEEALSYGETAFMFYTGAPQNSLRKPISQLNIAAGRALIAKSGLDESKIVVHSPYIINLANKENAAVADLAKSFLIQEMRRVSAFGLSILVLHPGSHVGAGIEAGLENVVEGLDKVLAEDGTKVRIALETMAGKGSEIGSNFEELAYLIKHCRYSDRLGVCLDTCHINDAGFDDGDIDGILSAFDKAIGLERLLVIHLNDSKNPRGSHKDRHENIGLGTIGFETLEKWAADPRLAGIPKILETPWVGATPVYKEEIAMLTSGQFDPEWRNKIIVG